MENPEYEIDLGLFFVILVNSLRKVKPYLIEYKIKCKERWIGMKIYDLFIKEFNFNTNQYYVWFVFILDGSHPSWIDQN